MKAHTGRAENLEILVGELIPDPKGWDSYVRLGGIFVKFWIWDALKRMPVGAKVRIRIEVIS